jgi:hypothetical protein
MSKEEDKILKRQREENTLIINDFNDFRDVLDNNDLDKNESVLSLACAVAVSICKSVNAGKMTLSSHVTGRNKNDFISADLEVKIKNIKYKEEKENVSK